MYGAITLCGSAFQAASINNQLGNSVTGLVLDLSVPTTPTVQRHQAYTRQV